MSQPLGHAKSADSLEDYVCVDGPSHSSSSSSTVTCKAVKGSHELRIHGYSVLKQLRRKRVESPAFDVGGHRWRLQLYPNGDSEDEDDEEDDDDNPGCEDEVLADHVGLFLRRIDSDSDIKNEPVFAKFRFSLLDQQGNPGHFFFKCKLWERFQQVVTWGREDWMRREVLEKPEHLKDDSFAVRCDVEVAVVTHCGREYRS